MCTPLNNSYFMPAHDRPYAYTSVPNGPFAYMSLPPYMCRKCGKFFDTMPDRAVCCEKHPGNPTCAATVDRTPAAICPKCKRWFPPAAVAKKCPDCGTEVVSTSMYYAARMD